MSANTESTATEAAGPLQSLGASHESQRAPSGACGVSPLYSGAWLLSPTESRIVAAALAIAHAARHPERVSHLILCGAYTCGWRHRADPRRVYRFFARVPFWATAAITSALNTAASTFSPS